MITFRFDPVKTAQAAAKFIRLRGGRASRLEVIKLLYLADREALLRWGRPITGDHYCSMRNGPVLSQVYNLIKAKPTRGYWHQHIQTRGVDLIVGNPTPEDDLSEEESNLIVETAERWQGVDKWTIRDHTHTLPEWKNPGNSSNPILIETILKDRKTPEEIEEIRSSSAELQTLKRILKCT